MSLFSGSRQVVYGFVPHCKQASLKAKVGTKEVETMVSTSDLGTTKGKVSHGTCVSCDLLVTRLVSSDAPSADSTGSYQGLDGRITGYQQDGA